MYLCGEFTAIYSKFMNINKPNIRYNPVSPSAKEISFQYVDLSSVSKDLLCGLCNHPLLDPMEHKFEEKIGCSQMYCKKCVRNATLCPHCQSNVAWKEVAVLPSTQKLLFKPLNELKVLCRICKQAFARGELAAHIPTCPLDCAWECGKKVAPKDVESHTKDCPMQIISCLASDVMCGWKGYRKDGSFHAEKCPYLQLRPVLLKLTNDLTNANKQIVELQQSFQNLRLIADYTQPRYQCRFCYMVANLWEKQHNVGGQICKDLDGRNVKSSTGQDQIHLWDNISLCLKEYK